MADEQAKSDLDSEKVKTDSKWRFKANDQPAAQPEAKQKASTAEPVAWTASEFIAHNKNVGWYLILAVVTAAIAALLFIITRDIATIVFICIGGAIIGFMGSRQPRELSFSVSDEGVQIGNKQFPYSDFRTFSVVQEVGIDSIWLIHTKRYMPAVTIYFEPKDQQKIIDVISRFLPMENRQLDPFDKLMHQIRF